MGRHALLGASVIVFCVTGLIVGIVRLARSVVTGTPDITSITRDLLVPA